MRNPKQAYLHIKKTDTIELVDKYNPTQTKLIISGKNNDDQDEELLFEIDNEVVGILIAKLNEAKWSRIKAKLNRAINK